MDKYYCTKCFALSDTDRCELCGKKRLKPVTEDDQILLTTLDFAEAALFEGALTEDGVPFRKFASYGAGIQAYTGAALERYSFFVLYSGLDRAQEILDSLFEVDEVIEEEEQ